MIPVEKRDFLLQNGIFEKGCESIREVKILDAMMGQGKTSAMINFINSSGDRERFLFITPFLTEVDRIITSCPQRNFKQPEVYGTKLQGIKSLLNAGANIVSTHKLFSRFDKETLSLIKRRGYILIMDEVASVVENLDIPKDDLDNMLQHYTRTLPNGRLVWTAPEYKGMFSEHKRLIENERVYLLNDSSLIKMMSPEIFRVFKEAYIMTYMFDCQIQRYYFDYCKIPYKKIFVSGDNIHNYAITEMPVKYKYANFKELIHICDNQKLNSIGAREHALSKNWYKKSATTQAKAKLQKHCYNFFKRIAGGSGTTTRDNIWTTFKEYKKYIKGSGYTKGFVSCNARATNEYKDRIAVAYLINKFIDPELIHFFAKAGIHMDNDNYALSEMLQFIWRSAIRDNKEIWVYIPSKRMRDLFIKWIDERSGETV